MLDWAIYIWEDNSGVIVSSGRTKEEAIGRFIDQFTRDKRAELLKRHKKRFNEAAFQEKIAQTQLAMVAMDCSVMRPEAVFFRKQIEEY